MLCPGQEEGEQRRKRREEGQLLADWEGGQGQMWCQQRQQQLVGHTVWWPALPQGQGWRRAGGGREGGKVKGTGEVTEGEI